jgi:hypothetical protein
MEARCMRCKEQREMKDMKIERTSRGGYIAKGKCVKCDTKMAKILSKDQAEKLGA